MSFIGGNAQQVKLEQALKKGIVTWAELAVALAN
jgi:hypothetical protein